MSPSHAVIPDRVPVPPTAPQALHHLLMEPQTRRLRSSYWDELGHAGAEHPKVQSRSWGALSDPNPATSILPACPLTPLSVPTVPPVAPWLHLLISAPAPLSLPIPQCPQRRGLNRSRAEAALTSPKLPRPPSRGERGERNESGASPVPLGGSRVLPINGSAAHRSCIASTWFYPQLCSEKKKPPELGEGGWAP